MSTDAQRVYNSLFPHYVEICAVTQYHKRDAKPGGWGGHATMFVRGAEIDADAGYPRLRLAESGTDPADADAGVGISVNRIFRNVNWVAIPGREEFFHGGIGGDRVLNDALYEAAVRRSAAAGWFAGIAIDDELMRARPASMPLEEFVVRHSIGTDFALTFARSVYCARLPMTREGIGKVVASLNAANDRARANGYVWNAYTNNCSHVLHNALAAAGIWDPKTARGPGALNVMKDVLSVARCFVAARMSDFSFPANSFVRAYEAGNERPIDDAGSAFQSRDVVRTLSDGWISTGPGALIVRYPIRDPSRNELFMTGRDPFLFSVPLFWDKKEEFARLTRDPHASLTDLGLNLARWAERYATILSRRSADEDPRHAADDADQRGFRAFRERFYVHIAAELDRTNARIAEFSRLSHSA